MELTRTHTRVPAWNTYWVERVLASSISLCMYSTAVKTWELPSCHWCHRIMFYLCTLYLGLAVISLFLVDGWFRLLRLCSGSRHTKQYLH